MNHHLRVGSGPRTLEDDLLRALEADRAGWIGRPTELARPLRIVVPSRSLRLHLGRVITTRLGAVAGVTIQTLFGLAREILARSDWNGRAGDTFFELAARRAVRAQRELGERLAVYADGYRSVVSSIRDLLDAGLEAGHEEALLEQLADPLLPRAEAERARAVVRAAVRVRRLVDAAGVFDRGSLVRAAKNALESDPGLVPARAVFVYGIADATGMTQDLLDALCRVAPLSLWLDHPRDPVAPEHEDAGVRFTARLRERQEGRATRVAVDVPEAPLATRTIFRAPGAEAETREVATRIRALLDTGSSAEDIAIVARDLEAYRAPLRTHLTRLGIPFSGLRTTGLADATTRRVAALVDVFQEREELSIDRWLDAVRRFPVDRPATDERRAKGDNRRAFIRPTFDLRLALRAAGVARLRDLRDLDEQAALDRRGNVVLPVRHGLERTEEREDAPRDASQAAPRDRDRARTMAPRRKLLGAHWLGAVAAGRSLLARLARPNTPWSRLAPQLERAVRSDLGWRRGDPAWSTVAGVLEVLANEIPADERLEPDELAVLFERAIGTKARPPFGGAGGGVLVLEAMEARARTFEHLFLVGLHRDAFPRTIREDPFLPDRARQRLTALLPDIPIKSRGHDEERYLFAQLASAASHVTLSFQVGGDDGEARAPSPFVERFLQRAETDPARRILPLVPHASDDAFVAPRTALESATLFGLWAGDEGKRQTLARALTPGFAGANGSSRRAGTAVGLARFHAAVRAEFDRRPGEALGPYFGFVGGSPGTRGLTDPAHDAIFVTTLERMASCPWQTLLLKVLCLEPAPDPLEALPSVDNRVIGSTVHAVLERIAKELGATSGELTDVETRTPIPFQWPAAATLADWTAEAAARALAEEHTPWPGLVRLLIARSEEILVAARERLEAHGPFGLLGAEVLGTATVPRDDAPPFHVRFRADQVARRGSTLQIVDFKTGRPAGRLATLKKETSRLAHFYELIARGKALQASAYVRGAQSADAHGSYLHLSPDLAPEFHSFGVDKGELVNETNFDAAVRRTLEAWSAGTFFPRLVDDKGKEPQACAWCEVSEACLRGDSGARRRLQLWMGAQDGGDADEASARARALFSSGADDE